MVDRRKSVWDIFIAYSADDWQHALALYELLSPHLSSFFDRRSLPEGADFDIAIPEAQRNARMTVVLVGKDYEKAYYARTEVALAIALARANPEQHSLVPIYLEGSPASQRVPYGLQLKHSFDLVQEGSWEAITAKLQVLLANEGAIDPSGTRNKIRAASNFVVAECEQDVKGLSAAELRMRIGSVAHSEIVLENVKVGPATEPPPRILADIETGDITGSKVVLKNLEQRKTDK